MTILWFNLALVYVFSFFSRYFAKPIRATISTVPIKPNMLLAICALLILILTSGLRSNIGDTYVYKELYKDNDFTWEYITSQKDMGFGILQMFLKNISDDPQIMLFSAALITNVLIIAVLLKYSRMFEISTYVYITGGLYLVSMNGVRQVLAASIAFTATKYLIEGNWIKYFAIVLLASTFHQSAIIMIPIYFLVRFKAWTKATFILLSASIIIVIGYDQFSSLLFSVIEDTQYGHYSDFDEGGANVIRVVVGIVPLLIAFLGREKLRVIFPNSDYIVNMSLLGLLFLIVSTQNWIFARFEIYFSLYQLILISWIIKLFSKKDQKLIYFSLVVCYFLFFYYEHDIILNITYRSEIIGGFFN